MGAVLFELMARSAWAEREATRLGCLQVHGARAPAPIILEVVCDALLAVQSAHARSFHSADVNEGVGAAVFRLNEAIAFVGIEELYRSSDHLMFFLLWRPPIGPPMLGEATKKEEGAAKAPKTV